MDFGLSLKGMKIVSLENYYCRYLLLLLFVVKQLIAVFWGPLSHFTPLHFPLLIPSILLASVRSLRQHVIASWYG